MFFWFSLALVNSFKELISQTAPKFILHLHPYLASVFDSPSPYRLHRLRRLPSAFLATGSFATIGSRSAAISVHPRFHLSAPPSGANCETTRYARSVGAGGFRGGTRPGLGAGRHHGNRTRGARGWAAQRCIRIGQTPRARVRHTQPSRPGSRELQVLRIPASASAPLATRSSMLATFQPLTPRSSLRRSRRRAPRRRSRARHARRSPPRRAGSGPAVPGSRTA